jgi:hypothetical protein
MRHQTLVAILFLIAYAPFAYADVRWIRYPSPSDTPTCRSFIPLIYGDISERDVKNLAKYFAEIRTKLGQEKWSDCKHSGPSGMSGMVIWLNSRGGEIRSAIEIGKMVRQNNMTAVVAKDAECSSACVLILGGAVVKNAYGRVGIHRPYFGSVHPSSNYSSIRKKREDLLDTIRTYLRDVDVSLSLVDMMEGTPPERIRYLTDAEMDEMRLHGEDSSFNERTTAEEASIYGISSLQYRQRISEANAKCAGTAPVQFGLCIDSILIDTTSNGASRYADYWTECVRSHVGYVSNRRVRECRTRAVQKVKSER